MEEWRKKLRISSVKLLWFLVPFGFVVLVVTMGAAMKGGDLMMSAKRGHQPWLGLWSSDDQAMKSYKLVSGGGADEVSSFNVVVLQESTAQSPSQERIVRQASSGVFGGGGGEGTSNSSTSTPTHGILERGFEKSVLQKRETMNCTNIETSLLPMNENQAHLTIRRRYSKLEKMEAKMHLSRAAIRDAKFRNESFDLDYVPRGPMYWNAKYFHRSYLEMEKQFKVFIYEEGEPPIFHNGPCRSIYALEGNFINQIENTRFRTRDPDKAHIFFLSIGVTSIVHFIYEKITGDQWLPMKQTVKDYVNLVAEKYPYWNRSLGADHLMLSCHDWGPELSKSVPELYGNSIRALCNANTTEGFDPTKDVSIPEINLPKGTIDGLIGGPSPSKRPILVFFAGGLHGPIRPILLEHWENKDKDVEIHKYLPKGVSYYGMIKKSRYCICPSGYEVASPRMVEAIYMGCVPVLIKDGYAPPFSDVLNWRSFAVIISVNDIPNLKKILSGISSRRYIRLQQRGQVVRRHFEVNFPPKRYDVFHMILHSVWLRRLNLRIHGLEEL